MFPLLSGILPVNIYPIKNTNVRVPYEWKNGSGKKQRN